MTDPAIVDKLQKIFDAKYYSGDDVREQWADYLNKYDVTLIDSEELVDEFSDMMNTEMFFDKKWVCLEDPFWLDRGRKNFILIEKSFAEKVVSLGGLP